MTAVRSIMHFLDASCRFTQYNAPPAQRETPQPIAGASEEWVGTDQSGLRRVASMIVIDFSKKSSGAYTCDQDVRATTLLKPLT